MIQLPPHKCGLFISHNEHKDYYQSIEKYIEDHDFADDFPSPEEMQKAIETDELWAIHWYPETPIGSLRVAAATLEEALRLANQAVTA